MHLKKKKPSIIEKSHIPNHSMTICLIIFFLVMFSTLESTYGGCAPVHYNNIDYLHINFTKLKINKTGYELWHAKGKHPLIVFNFIILNRDYNT